MTWKEIKPVLRQVLSGAVPVTELLDSPEFWESDENIIFGSAHFLSEHGRPADCVAIVDALESGDLSLSPGARISLLHLRGDALLHTEDYAGAVAIYDRILALEACSVAYNNRGLARWELGDYQNSLSDYLEALRLDPQNRTALRGAGEMLIKLDRPAQAVPYLRGAIEVSPDYSEAFTALGVAYFNAEEWVESYRALAKALELDPSGKIAARGIAKIEHYFDLDK